MADYSDGLAAIPCAKRARHSRETNDIDKMALEIEETNQSSEQSDSDLRDIPYQSYQDETASLDSKYRAIWSTEIGTTKQKPISYRKVTVLLLAWDSSIGDLGTEEQVN
jgi:hypothetical protein